MPRFFSPADKAADWQQLLAKARPALEDGQLGDITLYLGWVVGDAEYLAR